MAFTGVHLVITHAGVIGGDKSTQGITNGIVDSETVTNGAGTKAAPGNSDLGQPVFRLRASADYYVDIGQNPNSATKRMILTKDDGLVDIGVKPGDKIHVTAVP